MTQRRETGDMVANWKALHDYLDEQDGDVTLSWERLDHIVGGLPASATDHRAWWSGDRSHARAWRSAGFQVEDVRPSHSVTFVRDRPRAVASAADGDAEPPRHGRAAEADVILVTCVKTKRPAPSAAKDLYTSPLFRSERGYAEAAGRPWFILSAQHGLVAPEEWLAPYELYLPDTPREYRKAWGEWVAARLQLLTGHLSGLTIEVHASDEYVRWVATPLRDAGAVLATPLAGLSQGERLQWYAAQSLPRERAAADVEGSQVAPLPVHLPDLAESLVGLLGDAARAIAVTDLLGAERKPLQRPGLYSWWVDEEGAADLSRGLGHPIEAGLIYAGQAGATRWPSGRRSKNTLWSRLVGMHLGKKHEFSTFRRTLAAVLRPTDGGGTDERALTGWMSSHLKVVAVPVEDADALAQLEQEVLQKLDPPLNLMHMRGSEIRRQLKRARQDLSRADLTSKRGR